MANSVSTVDFEILCAMAFGEGVPSSEPAVARSPRTGERGPVETKRSPGAFVGAVRAKQGEGYGWPIALRCREPETVAFLTSSRSPCSNIYSGITRKAARMESAGSR